MVFLVLAIASYKGGPAPGFWICSLSDLADPGLGEGLFEQKVQNQASLTSDHSPLDKFWYCS